MFEVAFSDQSMGELNSLPIMKQMAIVEEISSLTANQLLDPQEPLGAFRRDGRALYRLRAGEYRIYFELKESILFTHYILHKNTFNDFAVRNKLPLNSDMLSEHDASFWSYLSSVGK